MTSPNISFGGGGIGFFPRELLDGMVEILEKHNVKEIDTAFIYPESEKMIGEAGLPKRFTISTKAPGFAAGALSKQNVLGGNAKSLHLLGLDSVDIYYLHSPDPATPIEETLAGISELYAAGKFKRFGVSNFAAADVQKIYDIQKAAGAVLPTVYQGHYNPVARHIEEDLFPLLRKLKMSFYAYSPVAGGFLVKDPAKVRDQTEGGRFGKESRVGPMYSTMYGKESLINALDVWAAIASAAGVSKAALAYRWVAYHSAIKASDGDGVIIGASKVTQLEETLTAIEAGPLDAESVKKIDAVWESVKAEAPVNNWSSFAALAPPPAGGSQFTPQESDAPK